MPLLSGVKLAGLAAVLLAVWLGYRWFTGVIEENRTLTANAVVLESAIAAERALREAADAERKRTEEIAARERKDAADRLLQAAKARKDIQNVAPVAQGCEPVNPGARYGLNWVLNAQGGSGPGTGTPTPPGGAAPLRPVPGP